MMARLGVVFAIIALIGIVHRLLRVYQYRRLQAGSSLSSSARPTLIVVVSAHCAVCPAQKNVVTLLAQRYPSLQVVTLDAETQMDRVRQLSVMTVPTTLLQDTDGTVLKINNGFIALEPLARQVEGMMRK